MDASRLLRTPATTDAVAVTDVLDCTAAVP
jgi:hypothetical protein